MASLITNETPDEKRARLSRVIEKDNVYESLFLDDRFIKWKEVEVEERLRNKKNQVFTAEMSDQKNQRKVTLLIAQCQVLEEILDWSLAKQAADSARDLLKKLDEKGD